MSIEIRPLAADDLEEVVTLDQRNFGAVVDRSEVEELTRHFDLSRFLVVTDGPRIVGAGGSYEFELTLPGGAAVPMSGVAWVSVAASHRRRGLLRSLMSALDAQAAERGEPASGLLASEAPIYERFGYGIATRTRVVEIDRRRSTIDRRWKPDPVELIDAQDHVEHLVEMWDRYRRGRPGELSRSVAQFRALVLDGDKPTFAALHPDGYAIYSIEMEWQNGHPNHTLRLHELVAVTPEAHLGLWNLVLSVDLVGPVRSYRAVTPDDPLAHLLSDPRALRTVELNDGLWLKVTDPVSCFRARSYRSDDSLTIGVVEEIEDLVTGTGPTQTFAVGSQAGSEAGSEPDLVACRAALGPLLLGTPATELAGGRRLRARPETLARADALLGWSPAAHSSTSF